MLDYVIVLAQKAKQLYLSGRLCTTALSLPRHLIWGRGLFVECTSGRHVSLDLNADSIMFRCDFNIAPLLNSLTTSAPQCQDKTS